MTNLKTSQLSYATTPLTGEELIGIVQNGVNVKATSSQISKCGFNYGNTITIGNSALNYGEYSTAIGFDTITFNSGGVAIGAYSITNGERAVAIGYDTYSKSENGVAIGRDAYSAGEGSVAIGASTRAELTQTIAIGHQAYARALYSIVIGSQAYANYYAGITIGYGAKTDASWAIAIGQSANSPSPHGISIGYKASAGAKSISIGSYAGQYPNNVSTVGIGKSAKTNGIGAVSVGFDTISAYRAVAIGYGAHANETGSISIGCYAYTGNPYAIAIGKNTGATGAYSFAIAGAHAVNFGSMCIGAKALDQTVSSFVVSGYPVGSSFLQPTEHYQKFFGQTSTDNPTVILTANGDIPGGANLPALAFSTISTISIRITGVGGDFFTSTDDAATYTLASPAFVFRNSSGVYTIINSPVDFSLENHTSGADAWTPPTLTIDGGSGQLYITVTNGSPVTYWMAHAKLETSG